VNNIKVELNEWCPGAAPLFSSASAGLPIFSAEARSRNFNALQLAWQPEHYGRHTSFESVKSRPQCQRLCEQDRD
jgi:hypothetical protein